MCITYYDCSVITGAAGGAESSPATDESGSTDFSGGTFKELDVSIENGVQIIKLNRPQKYNAITWEVRDREMGVHCITDILPPPPPHRPTLAFPTFCCGVKF